MVTYACKARHGNWNSITLTLWNWGGALGFNHCFQWQLVKTVIIWTLSSLGLSVNASVTENSALPCLALPLFIRQTDRLPLPLPCPALPWPPWQAPAPALPWPPCPALPLPHVPKQTGPSFLETWNEKVWVFLGYGFQDLDGQTDRHTL